MWSTGQRSGKQDVHVRVVYSTFRESCSHKLNTCGANTQQCNVYIYILLRGISGNMASYCTGV